MVQVRDMQILRLMVLHRFLKLIGDELRTTGIKIGMYIQIFLKTLGCLFLEGRSGRFFESLVRYFKKTGGFVPPGGPFILLRSDMIDIKIGEIGGICQPNLSIVLSFDFYFNRK